MKRNMSATSEMTKSGDQWVFCPSDSATICWTTEKVTLLTQSLQSNPAMGIYACIASNDVGTAVALSNLVNPEQPSEWQFALGIDIVDSLACGLRIMMEVFTWTPSILPTKVTLEYHECSFSVEFSISFREKQWRIDKISRGSIRRGKFEIRNLPSNTLTAVRVYMSCASGEPVISNTVYGWSKATGNDTKCALNLISHEESKSKAAISESTPAPEQDFNTPVKFLLACGILILVLLSALTIIFVCRCVGMRARKHTSSGASYSSPQNGSTWRDGCNESPAVCTTSIPANTTNYRKGDFQFIPQALMSEHVIKGSRQARSVTILNNSIEGYEMLKGAPSGSYNRASLSPTVEMKELSSIYERSVASTLPKIEIAGKDTGWSPTR
nr:hypothetical protein HmN_000281100 [Hymenolepis microstoma]